MPKLTSPKYERVEMEKFLKDKYPFLLKAFLEIAINFISWDLGLSGTLITKGKIESANN